MFRVKVWHTDTTVWLLKNYTQRIVTYYTRILLLDLTYGRTMAVAEYKMERQLYKVAVRLCAALKLTEKNYIVGSRGGTCPSAM